MPELPKGFSFIEWEDVPVHAVVFRLDRLDTPYRVIDPDQHILQKLAGSASETVHDTVLLVQNGPIVVLTVGGSGRYSYGFYADMPMTLYKYNVLTGALTVTRPKSIDGLSNEANLAIRDASGSCWPPFYGKWTLVENSDAGEVISFEITNRLSANALASELIRTGRQFKITPNQTPGPTDLTVGPTYWTFTVPKGVYSWILSMCADRIVTESTTITRNDIPFSDAT